MSNQPDLADIRERIHTEYRQALEACKVIAKYLDSRSELVSKGNGRSGAGRPPVLRNQVLAAISTDAKTAMQIATDTDIDVKRVKGVLYDPGVKNRLRRTRRNRRVFFKLKNGDVSETESHDAG